ncbi:hypothetical protein PR048_027762, partial [Dryococelus australis]
MQWMLTANSKTVEMVQGTDAAISVIPLSKYNDKFRDCSISVKQKIYSTGILYQGEIVLTANYSIVGDLILALNMSVLTNINKCKASDGYVDKLTDEFKDMFDDKQGTCKHKLSLGSLNLKGCHLHFKPKLNTKFKGLKRKVQSLWWTPPDGGISICTKYKVTVNNFLEEVRHSIPQGRRLICCQQG